MSDLKKKKDANSAPNAKVGVQLADLVDSGWRVAIAFLAPSLLGIWIDRTYTEGRAFTIIGVLVGFALAHLVVMRYVKTKYSGGGK